MKVSEEYINNYLEIGKKLKNKDYKNKLFQVKNKMTTHSRMPPDVIKTLRNYVKGCLLLERGEGQERKAEALWWVLEGCKLGVMAGSLIYTNIVLAIDLMRQLNIDPYAFQTTEIYQQILPRQYLDKAPLRVKPGLFTKKDELFQPKES